MSLNQTLLTKYLGFGLIVVSLVGKQVSPRLGIRNQGRWKRIRRILFNTKSSFQTKIHFGTKNIAPLHFYIYFNKIIFRQKLNSKQDFL